jgi:protein-disulfide isomerase
MDTLSANFIPLHPYAALAAVAAECAGEQGQFWEMHHMLLDQTARWATEDAENVLVTLAESLPLDHSRFEACFNGREVLERVLHDLYDAQGVVQSTPTFIVIEASPQLSPLSSTMMLPGFMPTSTVMTALPNSGAWTRRVCTPEPIPVNAKLPFWSAIILRAE